MNWVGGRLQRHSKASKNEVLQRQKQHFAKLRQQLQKGSEPSSNPFHPGWSTGIRDDMSTGLADMSRGKSQRPSQKSQRKLEDFDNTAPMARRLSRKPSPRVHATTVKNSKGVRDASRSCTGSPMPAKARISLAAGSNLEATRHRLLQQADWVGLGYTRPLKIKFKSHHDKQQIGKRRRVRRDKKESHIRNYHAVSRALAPLTEEPIDDEQYYMRGALQPMYDNISIRIGQDAIPSQTATGHQPSLDTLSMVRQPSDTMLFDEAIRSSIDRYGMGEQLYDLEMPDVRLATEVPSPRREHDCNHSVFQTMFAPAEEEELVFNMHRPEDPDTPRTMVQAETPMGFRREGVASMPQSPLLREKRDTDSSIRKCIDAEGIDVPKQAIGGPTPGSRLVFRSPDPPSLHQQEVLHATGDQNDSSHETPSQQDQGASNHRAEDFDWPQILTRPSEPCDPSPQQAPTSKKHDGNAAAAAELAAELVQRSYEPDKAQGANGAVWVDKHIAAPLTEKFSMARESIGSDPNEVWKQFIFNDGSSSVEPKPESPKAQFNSKTRSINSSLFCWRSTADPKKDTSPSTVDPVRCFSEARPNRVKRRQTHTKHPPRSNVPIARYSTHESLRDESPDTSSLRRKSPPPTISMRTESMFNNASVSAAPSLCPPLAADPHLGLANARSKDSWPAPVRPALLAGYQGSDEGQHLSPFAPRLPKHAEAARYRSGPKHVAAGENETGRYAARAATTKALPLASSSIFDLRQSDGDD